MSSVFACTLDMINKDMAEYPEHRVSFFKMIQAINMNCFPALLQLPPSDFALFLDSIVWAFKHTMRDVADTGLIVCLELVNNFAASDIESSNAFFQQHYIRLLQDVFVVLTDTEHKAGMSCELRVSDQCRLQEPVLTPCEAYRTCPNKRHSNPTLCV